MRKGMFISFLVIVAGLVFAPVIGAEDGVTDKEIIIGSQLPLSGPIAVLGVGLKNGLDMRAKEINEAGGIHGRKIKMVVGDHAYDPKTAIMLTNKMINRDKVLCFILNFASAPTLAVLPLTTKKKVPMVFPVSPSKKLTTPFNRYVFSFVAPYESQGRVIAKYGVKTKGYKRFGLLYQDDDFGNGILNGLKQQLPVYNLDLIAAEPYKRGATDFSSQIAKLRKAKVDVVAFATIIRETVGAVKEMRKIGWDVPILSSSSASSHIIPFLAKKSGFSIDGLTLLMNYPDPTATDLPAVKDWTARYTKIYGKPPRMVVMAGYDYLNFLSIALERAGRDLTREKLVDALESFKDVPSSLGGAPATFSSTTRLSAKYWFIAQIQGGKFWRISDWLTFEE